jgi:hypothetical protein
MKNFAYYKKRTGVIENVIFLDPQTVEKGTPVVSVDAEGNQTTEFVKLEWPAGYAVVRLPDEGINGERSMCGVGWKYQKGQFIEPPNPSAD